MPTYVYETIPTGKTKPKRYEIRHGISQAALKQHPETGEKIRRVVAGGAGIITHAKPAPVNRSGGGHCCGASCGCH